MQNYAYIFIECVRKYYKLFTKDNISLNVIDCEIFITFHIYYDVSCITIEDQKLAVTYVLLYITC